MGKGGIIIRLIDVAMIILFGFIAISDIKVRAQIKLPSNEEEKHPEEKQDEPTVIFVKIVPGQGFVLEADDDPSATLFDASSLEQEVVARMERYREAGRDAVVLIEPDQDSMIQQTVEVLDICERNKIPKNINYESMQF